MSLQNDSPQASEHEAVGVIRAGSKPCPYCGEKHDEQVVFCPQTGMAVPSARDDFCGRELAGAVTVIRPIRRKGAVAFYEGMAQDGFKVMVKRLLPEEDTSSDHEARTDGREDFSREGRALTLLSDLPFVPRLLSLTGRTLAMLWVEGPSLADILAQPTGPGLQLDLDEAVDHALSLVSSVRILHGRHLCHRALFPDNIVLQQPEGNPVLLGFASSRHFADNDVEQSEDLFVPASNHYHQGLKREDFDDDEAFARALDQKSCAVITAQLLVRSVGLTFGPDELIGKEELRKAISSLPVPVKQPFEELVLRLLFAKETPTLTRMVQDLESLRLLVDRHLTKEEDEHPGGPISMPPVPAEETLPVPPRSERTESIDRPEPSSPKTKLFMALAGVVLLLAGLWFLQTVGKNRKTDRHESPPAGSQPPQQRVEDRPKGMGPEASKPGGLSRDAGLPPQTRTVLGGDAGVGSAPKTATRQGPSRPPSPTARPARRNGMKPPHRKGPSDEEFIRAVDKAPEDL